MAERSNIHIGTSVQGKETEFNQIVELPSYFAKKYELKDPRFTKTQKHLCLCCDLFFQHVQKAWVPAAFQEPINDSVRAIANEHIYPHWARFQWFKNAAEQGCHICQLFLSQLTEAEQESLVEFERTGSQHGTIQLLFPSRHWKAEQHRLRLKFKAPEDWQNLNLGEVFSNLTMDRTDDCPCQFNGETNGSDRRLAIWEVAFAWITQCVVNHLGCRKQLLPSQALPSRLIAVGSQSDYSDLRLCNSGEIGRNTLYLTLSHCWGPSGVSFKLHTANESNLYERIPLSELSQTFRDAIDFTRRLQVFGVNYIWIDALCILQDSKEDWQNEASKMGEIYGGSFCNLAACTGPDGSSGLYPKYDKASRCECTIKAGINSCLSGSFAVRNKDIFRNNARNDLILSRGWCVQELALAPRVLYFGRGHTVWDCFTMTAEDLAPTRRMVLKDGYGFTSRKFGFLAVSRAYDSHSLASSTIEKDVFKYYQAWMDVVREYSLCNLTRHTDRLIAISGIARQIQAGIGSHEEYVAGLWKSFLPFHLLWDCTSSRSNFQLWPYRAPSWSWASVESGVYNHLTNAEAVANSTPLIQASTMIELETADPFGSVQNAILHVKGPIFKAFLGPRGHRNSQHLCQIFVLNNSNDHPDAKPECVTDCPAHLDINYPGPEPVVIYCLFVILTAYGPGRQQLIALLLVRQDTSSVRGRYIRIGRAWGLSTELLSRARSSWRLTDWAEYEDEVEGGDYQISII